MTPTPTLREALEEARQHVEFIADGGVESVAQLRAAIDLLPRIDAALSTPEPQGWRPIDEAPKDGRLIATWNPRQPSISRFLRWGTPNLSKDRAWITPKGCAPTYLPTQFLILPPPPEPQK